MPAYGWSRAAASYFRFDTPDVVRAELDRALKGAIARAASISEDLRAGRIGLEEWQATMRGLSREAHLYGGNDELFRPLTRDAIRTELDRALKSEANRAASLSEDLRAGRISLGEWRQGMRGISKDAHLYSAALGNGGFEEMTQADYGRVGQILRHGPEDGLGEYEYLERLSQDIEDGLPLDGRFIQRSRMYAEAARSTYHDFDGRLHEEEGFDEERNIRHADDSCDGCFDATDMGWVPIGELPPIGTRTCLRNCQCTIDYRKTAA